LPDPTTLLTRASAGDSKAVSQLMPLVYNELRKIAASYLRRERPGQTLQATGLVHEAYLRLMRDRNVQWQNKAHFCAIAANAMRQILVERARARGAIKRGGAWNRLTLNEGTAAAPEAAVDVEVLDQALARLAEHDAGQARLVELRYFGGLTIEETADVLGVSPATVKRSWMVARAWLKKELGGT
jgi:RNA polymerase sigma-70 factor (ECF subfamily)